MSREEEQSAFETKENTQQRPHNFISISPPHITLPPLVVNAFRLGFTHCNNTTSTELWKLCMDGHPVWLLGGGGHLESLLLKSETERNNVRQGQGQ